MGLNSDAASAIAEHLGDNASLTHLSLRSNSFGDFGVIALAAALERSPAISRLALSGSKFDLPGLQALVRLLERCTPLRELDVADCLSHDAPLLASALASNRVLRSIDVSNCRIGNLGAEAFATMLESNSSLKALYLVSHSHDSNVQPLSPFPRSTVPPLQGSNQIDNAALFAALSKNKALTSLSLERNEFSALRRLRESLALNHTLKILDLTSNFQLAGPVEVSFVGIYRFGDMQRRDIHKFGRYARMTGVCGQTDHDNKQHERRTSLSLSLSL